MATNDLTRRGFLRGSATTVAFPYVITTAALGNEAKSAASERVTIGHIGVGGQGSFLFSQFQKLKALRAWRSPTPTRTVAISAAQCGGKSYADFREILGRGDVDAVIVATPDHWHVPVAVMAARAGKDCYVEKPLGICAEQDLLCRKVFQENNRVFQYGTQQRSRRIAGLAPGWCRTGSSARSGPWKLLCQRRDRRINPGGPRAARL